MLERLGKFPDVSIREFNNLFIQDEWNEIQLSAVYKQEEEIKTIKRKKLDSVQSVLDLLTRLQEVQALIKQCSVSQQALRLKKERLTFASKIPKSRQGKTDLWQEVRHKSNDAKVFKTFSPFTILIAAGRPGSEVGNVRFMYNHDNDLWEWNIPPPNSESCDAVESAGRLFVQELNG
jgi:hypothetical protein